MNKKLREEMLQTKRLKLGFMERLTHYGIVYLLLFIFSFSIPDLYDKFINDIRLRDTSEDTIIVGFACLILSVMFYFIQKGKLKFREVFVEQTVYEFKEAVWRTQRELEWKVESCTANHAVATSGSLPTGSWGERITLIREDDRILINSICDPQQPSSVVSFGWNRRNVRRYFANLLAAKQGIPQVIINPDSIIINEWSILRTLIRLVLYPFSLFIIVIGFIGFIPEGKIGLALGAISMGSAYIYWDIQALKLNKRLKEERKTIKNTNEPS